MYIYIFEKRREVESERERKKEGKRISERC